MPLEVHVVSHTHWDREWYHPAGRFRQRLVRLVDELLDDPPPPGASFLLDGQAIVLEDYLAVRPERRDELATLLRDRRLEAGPWYVLADELIPSGEAIVRNLLAGRRAVAALGSEAPPVLYCPDSFGHPAALPTIARGFGLDVVILWRGYGGRRWPPGDTVRWHGPDGESAILHHLPPDGYEFGSSLPLDAAGAAARWRRLRDVLAPRAALGVTLLTHGADHHARQVDAARALARLRAVARGADARVVESSLAGFAARLRDAAAAATLPVVGGELRDSYGYTWALQGTFASRAAQKRRNARAERVLLREAEPWGALAARGGDPAFAPLLRAAWRTLLECHPHDSLCGCSVDTVARAVDARLTDAIVQGRGIRDDALLAAIEHDPVAARTRRDEWTPCVVVRNAAARPRRGVAEVRVARFVRDVPVGPGSARSGRDRAASARAERAALARERIALLDGDRPLVVQPLASDLATDLVESPRHYPDADRVVVSRALVWIDEVRGYGTRSLGIGDVHAGAVLPDDIAPVTTGAGFVDNGLLRVEWSAEGAPRLRDLRAGRTIEQVVALEDQADHGDLYTTSLRGSPRTIPLVAPGLVARGPLRGSVAFEAAISGVVHGRVTLALDAGVPFLRVLVQGENQDVDHRVRLVFGGDVEGIEVWADAAFGPVRRTPIDAPREDCIAETPPATAPLHRYVSRFAGARGLTIYSDGLAEYEAMRDGRTAVTLVRAVGELSRDDLPDRPGHAGWPAPTPLAQSLGPFRGCFALAPHGARDAASVDALERLADDVLLPLRGGTLRSALAIPAPTTGIELEGRGLAFAACKPAERDGWITLRAVNLLDTAATGRWRFGRAPREAVLARLDETPLAPLPVLDDGIAFEAGPRGTVTVLVR